MTYRDDRYHAFIREARIKCHRNISITIGKCTSSGDYQLLDHPIQASVSEFRDYLYFIGTRGNAFWECYYLRPIHLGALALPMPRLDGTC